MKFLAKIAIEIGIYSAIVLPIVFILWVICAWIESLVKPCSEKFSDIIKSIE